MHAIACERRWTARALFPLAAFITILSSPAIAWAQIVVYSPQGYEAQGYPPAERERLLARTGEELSSWPIPNNPMAIELEIDLLEEQIDTIDIGGITALQWIGAIFMIGGAVPIVIGALGALVIELFGGGDALEWFGIWAGIGLGIAAPGALMLGLAELDGNLQRRRELARRRSALRRAVQQYVSLDPAFFAVPGGGGLALRGTF